MHRIGFFTEQGYEGKIDRKNNINLRTDSSWISAIGATHHPLPKLFKLPDDLYDICVMIIPKDRRELLNRPILEHYRRVCKKVTVMQESYYNYWQDSPINEQIWYFNFLVEMDMIFCHNRVDKKYYTGLTDVPCELMPTLMLTDDLVPRHESGNGVIIGGNWVKDYGGFDSYQVALEITDDIMTRYDKTLLMDRYKDYDSFIKELNPYLKILGRASFKSPISPFIGHAFDNNFHDPEDEEAEETE